MTPLTYRNLRERIGSVPVAARVLGLGRRTIERRESGRLSISRESAIAIRAAADRAARTTGKA